MPRRRFTTLSIGVVFLAIAVAGCNSVFTSRQTEPSAITDAEYLTDDRWNDGQAEVAFYQVERSRDQYGRPNEQRFIAGTYLVKHRFSPTDLVKVTDGSGVSAFKYSLFYEFESGSYEYKRNWVVNVRQKDLRPLKQSFTSFDWCSNLYRELAFPSDGSVEVRMRSDDYGNRRTSFAQRPNAYPFAELPLLIRGLDFGATDTLSFSVPLADSSAYVSAQAVRTGTDSIETEAGTYDTDRIVVHYESSIPSLIGEEADTTEIYWRGTGPERLLVQMEADGGRYRMTLVEHLRTAYWEENLWPMLDRIETRP